MPQKITNVQMHRLSDLIVGLYRIASIAGLNQADKQTAKSLANRLYTVQQRLGQMIFESNTPKFSRATESLQRVSDDIQIAQNKLSAIAQNFEQIANLAGELDALARIPLKILNPIA